VFRSRRGNPFPVVLTVFDDAFNCEDGSVVSRRNILGLEGTHRNLEELVDNAVKLFGPWAVAGGATSDTEPTVAQFRDDEPGGVASGTLGSQLKQEEQSESGARVIWSYSLSVVSLLSLACNYS
jgi:hypothetical protein